MWIPIHETHAIDRVRLIVQYDELVPRKVVSRAAAHILEDPEAFGFDTVETVSPPSDKSLNLMLSPDARLQVAGNEGHVFKCLDAEEVVEEAGFRSSRLGYLTRQYGRWESLYYRVEQIFSAAFDKLEDIVGPERITLEYWDAFTFDGQPEGGDPLELLCRDTVGIPPEAIQPGALWHTHVGWFAPIFGRRTLINRNIDVQVIDVNGESRLTVKIYTSASLRSTENELNFREILEYLNSLHSASGYAFGRALKEKYRESINLDLANYRAE
ncbi:TIGR04255 family protein [Albimonas sp. CAU 1670]|uniref:TIGR04255 family protein n=1 Tax=Albimonas sp. CAU 1670 TaxID=3032599 RepID=UPI0023DB9779|nr:TIGR04255 family protein [Albimonas sp. CAU 1670]MDF2235375.1 TIGR04255 family protein [Albimonas sp. CAU 1670]